MSCKKINDSKRVGAEKGGVLSVEAKDSAKSYFIKLLQVKDVFKYVIQHGGREVLSDADLCKNPIYKIFSIAIDAQRSKLLTSVAPEAKQRYLPRNGCSGTIL